MRYAKLGLATKAYADRLNGDFAVSFELQNQPSLSVVLDRTTLVELQNQIAFALSPQQPGEDQA